MAISKKSNIHCFPLEKPNLVLSPFWRMSATDSSGVSGTSECIINHISQASTSSRMGCLEKTFKQKASLSKHVIFWELLQNLQSGWKIFQDFLKDYKISKVSSHIYLYYVSKLSITKIFQWIPFLCMFVPSSCLSFDHEVDKPIFELMKKGSYRSKMCTKRSLFLSY